MHPESKVFIRGQQRQMTEATGEYEGFTHKAEKAKDIQDKADVTGYSTYRGWENVDGYDLRTRGESDSFHVSSNDWPLGIRYSAKGYEKIAEAVEKRIGKAPVTVVVS